LPSTPSQHRFIRWKPVSLQLLYLLGLIVAANGCIVLAVVYPSHAAVIVVGYLLCMFLCAMWLSQSLKLSSKEMFALKVCDGHRRLWRY
jgi:hypothetical protein